MSAYKLGVIGAGVMGEAILKGVVQSGVVTASDVYITDIDDKKVGSLSERYGVRPCADAAQVVERCDIVLLAVKPAVCGQLLLSLGGCLNDKAVISIVAGWLTAKFRAVLPENTRLLCVMPNVNAVSGEAMSVLSADTTFNQQEQDFAKGIFSSFGRVEQLEERFFDIATGISGSGPAYVFMFIEAMIQAGIYNGLPAAIARRLAEQTVLGAAKTLQESGKHPAELRDAVCTPGGTTIEAVKELEERGFMAAVMAAVEKCSQKYVAMVGK